MALVKFNDTYPSARDDFSEYSGIAHFDDYTVYTEGGDKIGAIEDALFEEETGNIRYLIVDTGVWVFGKSVLLPIGLAHFDADQKRVIVDGLTKDQVKDLPDYSDETPVDRDYENQVQEGYRSLGDKRKLQFLGQTYDADLQRAYPGSAALHGAEGDGKAIATYYDSEAGLYGMDDKSHQAIRLYQDRLTADMASKP